MKNLNGFFLAIVYILSVSFYYLDKSETLKYFQYILPIIGLLVTLNQINRTWSISGDLAKLSNVVAILIFSNFIVLLVKQDLYFRYFQEGFLFIGAIIFTITLVGSLVNDIETLLKYVLVCLSIIFLIEKGSSLFSVLSSPGDILIGMITSTIETESSLSFYFAVLSIYFVIEKEKIRALWSILFMVISFKRIAIVGFFVALTIYFLFKMFRIKYNRKIFSVILSVFNLGYLWITLLLVTGNFDQTISNYFGVSSNFLFMGRLDLYNNVFVETGYFDLFGVGIGKISDILKQFVDNGTGEGVLVNLHSDILKYYLEFGAILFPIFIYNFIYYLSKNINAFCLLIMLNVILLTDNVSIYFSFMVLFYLIDYKLGYYTLDKGHNREFKKNYIHNDIPVGRKRREVFHEITSV